MCFKHWSVNSFLQKFVFNPLDIVSDDTGLCDFP